MARTWPALYQMLPSWSAVLAPDDHPLLSTRQLTFPDGWVDTSDVAPSVLDDMCRRAREAQALFEGPFSYIGPHVGKLVILGREQHTPITVVRELDDTMRQDHETSEPGDSLVPAAHTLSWGGKPFAGWVLALTGCRDHSWLCAEEETVDAIQRKLKQPTP
jgi:hypothetical protein